MPSHEDSTDRIPAITRDELETGTPPTPPGEDLPDHLQPGDEPELAPRVAEPELDGDPAAKLREAQRLLAQAEEERREQCLSEIRGVLAKYGYNLTIIPAQIGLERD